MTSSKTLSALALIALLGVAACDSDPQVDQPPAANDPAMEQPAPQQGQQEMDPEMMALMMEAQELQQRLAAIQDEAMQDEALAAQLTSIQDEVEAGLREEAPELLAQMEEYEAEYMAAQEAGDQERVQAIAMEAQQAQMEIQAAQQSVLSRPDIAESIDDFEEAQHARMIEIDPEAREILDRLDEIRAQMPQG
ncbi:MAG: hypothetical protein EA351_02590 [Gemmatimonadales bacterium]|nr:MAG: hypothetical protein EA351_02590 [Gemmatimonadales bacterium]